MKEVQLTCEHDEFKYPTWQLQSRRSIIYLFLEVCDTDSVCMCVCGGGGGGGAGVYICPLCM